MANIKPLRAWRYHPRFSNTIGEYTSPLFDVVDEKQRMKLYKNPLNSIHLSVPQGDSPADHALELLEDWKREQIIVRDRKPSIYVYYQHFNLQGDSRAYCRKGFICMIEAYDWQDGVLLRHESTIPKAVNDRIDLLRKTKLNVSATHGLYSDPEFRLEALMDKAMLSPVYDVEDYQGVRDVMAIIDNPQEIAQFVATVAEQSIILADGHHRYEGSMVYRKEMRDANPNHNGTEEYNFHLMFLTNAEAKDLRILPTHRLLANFPDFDEIWFLEQLNRYFTIKELDDSNSVNEVIAGKPWAFGLLLSDQAYKIRLKPEAFDLMDWKFPNAVKRLDLTVLHYFVFERILGIKRNEQRSSEYITFERNYSTCLAKVASGKANAALITNEISIEQVKEVCHTGYTMPQKSTYFYPKVICGFLFGDVS